MNRTLIIGALLLSMSIASAQGAPSPISGGLGIQTVNRDMQVFLSSNEYFPIPGDSFSLTIVLLGTGSQADLMSSSAAGNGNGSNRSTTYTLVLMKDYSMYVPVAGTLSLKGLNYDQIRAKVTEAVNRRMAPDFIDFQFLQPVSFQILVNGLVRQEGLVSVSSIARVSDAIQAAGGLRSGATLRRITLERGDGGKRVVDMQEYLREGRKDSNPLLLPGDRIVVGPLLKSARIEGAVLSPGSYELTDADRIPDLIRLANGLSPKSLAGPLRVVRADGEGGFSMLEIESDRIADFELRDGDAVQVPTRDTGMAYVTVEGPFYGKPASATEPVNAPMATLGVPALSSGGAELQSISLPQPVRLNMPHHPGLNLYEIMEYLGGPTLYARGSIGRIYDAKGAERASFDVIGLWSAPDEARKVILSPGDFVLVPMKNQVVSVAGEVFIPRVLPYMEKRTVREYMALAGGVKPSGMKGSFTVYDSTGGKKKAGLDYVPQPEDVIMVNQNGWAAFLTWWSQPGPIAATTTVIGFASIIIGLISDIQGASWTWLISIFTKQPG